MFTSSISNRPVFVNGFDKISFIPSHTTSIGEKEIEKKEHSSPDE